MEWAELYNQAEDFKTMEFMALFKKYNNVYSINQIISRMPVNCRPKIQYFYRKSGYETKEFDGLKYITHYPNIDKWFTTAYME